MAAPGQPAYPWRGRITCHPAPGSAGSPDGTAAAATQVAAFVRARPARLSPHGRCTTPHLAEAAGGVDGFILGSELVGLTRVRSASGVYPAVTQLLQLARDVRAMLGAGTEIVYAADWTEYGAHVLDGGDEVRFPLDPLLAIAGHRRGRHRLLSADLAIGATVRTMRDLAIARSVYDVRLSARVASAAARPSTGTMPTTPAARRRRARRSPMGPTASRGCFAPKDLVAWWSNPHVERVGGVEIRSRPPGCRNPSRSG